MNANDVPGSSSESRPALQVYGHIRSGNNYLAECLRRSFYAEEDVSGPSGEWGHWSDRQPTAGTIYGALLGDHEHYSGKRNIAGAIYIHRDGRAVAHSAWRSAHFMNKSWSGISLAEYLRRPLDWVATPARRRRLPLRRENIIQHWMRHVTGWLEPGDPSVAYVRYEDLIADPVRVIESIGDFFDLRMGQKSDKPDLPAGPIGYSPNEMAESAWQREFSAADLRFYESIVGSDIDRLRASRALGTP